jgi:uncharacterized protein
MDLVPKIPAGRQLIEGYGDGGFRVAGHFHPGSVLIFPDRTIELNISAWAEIDANCFAALLMAEPKVELLLMGAGRKAAALHPDLRKLLRLHGIRVETLDTGAACRTYNVLLSEDRRVAAFLIAVD